MTSKSKWRIRYSNIKQNNASQILIKQKIKQQDKEKIQPITLSLIQKYSFTRKFRQELDSQSDSNSTVASETASQQDDTESIHSEALSTQPENQKLDVLELPENILMLKVFENPFCKAQTDHRKQIVLHLEQLEELDRIKVIQAERLSYKGLIKCDVDKLLEKYRNDRQMKDAKERMEQEMYLEYMDEIGVPSSERMMKSLDEFAKMDEFKQLHKQFQDIMKTQKEKSDIQDNKSDQLRKDVEKQVDEVMKRYSRQGSRRDERMN
ncbi:UNKNOWN [Stylonychia lemnae]|uniref:Uncharacterized protein n=1 Tax=Stylonychia lemnae TaxID=5949 RepID=A0A078B395_STYLE|nr:UNKNOWN [Stylonychia lemnae]|eukprot:CDW88904.1 UNKNOWN [Stylonychia lemnae]